MTPEVFYRVEENHCGGGTVDSLFQAGSCHLEMTEWVRVGETPHGHW